MIEKSKISKILLCRCAIARVVPPEQSAAVRAGLARAGAAFEEVADLCGLAARRDARLKAFADGRGAVVACYPRAVRWLFAAAAAPLDAQARLLNMRAQSPDQILGSLLPEAADDVPAAACDCAAAATAAAAGTENRGEPAADAGWMPWFPVIDYDRCSGCKQCMGFCLFGVYAADDDGRIVVANPAHCKTNCPACARICPRQAIIFPKYNAAPINGDEPSDAEDGETTQVDLAGALGPDIYAALRGRAGGGRRFAPADDRQVAEEDRQAAEDQRRRFQSLEALRKQLDVPADLAASLAMAGGLAQSPCGRDCGCDCQTDSQAPDGDAGTGDCDCDCDAGGGD